MAFVSSRPSLPGLAGRCFLGLCIALFGFTAHAVSFEVTTNADGSRTYTFPGSTIGSAPSTYEVPPPGSTTGNRTYTPVTPIANNNNFGGMTWESSPHGGGLVGHGAIEVPVGTQGQTTRMYSTTGLSTGALAAGVARLLGGPAGMVASIAIPALVDWMNQNGIEPMPDGSGWRDKNNAPLNPACSTFLAEYQYMMRNNTNLAFTVSGGGTLCTIRSYEIMSDGSHRYIEGGDVTRTVAENTAAGTPMALGDIENRLANGTSPPPGIVPGLLDQGVSVPVSSPVPATTANPSPPNVQMDGPSSVQVGDPVVTVVNPDPATGNPGSTTTTVVNNYYTYSGDTVSHTTTTTTTVQPNAPIGSPPGTPLPAPIVTTTTGDKPSTTFNGCGLPGGPACRIDETGVHTSSPTDTNSLKGALDGLDAALPAIAAGDTSWGLTPWWLQGKGCSPFKVMDLPPKLGMGPVMVDICPALPTIHLLMDFLWITFTFFAVVSMVRSTVSV